MERVEDGSQVPGYANDSERRFALAEIEAIVARHFYGLTHEELAYVLDTFPIVKRKDEAQWHESRTKRVILEIYDAMAEAARTGIPYQTRLSPPPADAAVAHPWPEEIIQVAVASKDAFSNIAALPDEIWATPVGVTPDNVALFSLIDVLQAVGEVADPERVRLAAILVRKPVLAAAFMDDAQVKQWLRLIGSDARPVRGNVVQISQFQKNGVDTPPRGRESASAAAQARRPRSSSRSRSRRNFLRRVATSFPIGEEVAVSTKCASYLCANP